MSTPEGLCTRCSATQYCAEHAPPPAGTQSGTWYCPTCDEPREGAWCHVCDTLKPVESAPVAWTCGQPVTIAGISYFCDMPLGHPPTQSHGVRSLRPTPEGAPVEAPQEPAAEPHEMWIERERQFRAEIRGLEQELARAQERAEQLTMERGEWCPACTAHHPPHTIERLQRDLGAVVVRAEYAENQLVSSRGQVSDLCDQLEAARTALAARERDIATVLKAFDDDILIRNIARDHEPGWAMRLLPLMGALGRLAQQPPPTTTEPEK